MSLVILTRPDNTPVAINPDEVVHLAPVPKSGPLVGPLTEGTRIVFRNQSHQDVKELLDEAVAKIDASRTGAPTPLTGAPPKRKRTRASK